jgi:hypothetical protein
VPADAFNGGGGGIFHVNADFLLYHFRPTTLPATAQVVPVGLISVDTTNLLTAAPGGPVTPATPAVVGFAPVSIVSNSSFGNTKTDFSSQVGGRITLGYWFDREQTWGLEVTGETVDRGVNHFAVDSGNSPNQFFINTGFTRSLFLVNAGPPVTQTLLSTFPILVVRQAQSNVLGSSTNDFYSGEINATGVFLRVGCLDIGGLFGFRYLLYQEEINLATNSRLFRPAGFPVTTGDATASLSQDLTFSTVDSVRVRNHFFGAQAGLDLDFKFGSFFLDVRGKLALGDMHQQVQVSGVAQVVNNDPARPTPASSLSSGGLFSGPLDQGTHSRDRFSYVPEVNARFGCQVTSWLRAYFGYDGLLIGHAGRAADATTTNTLSNTITVAGSTNSVNVSQPAFRFSDRDVWVNGFTLGCELRY